MMEAMGSAISGLEAQQTMLNTTANNLANVDTIGYKSQETSFVDELSQTLGGGSTATSFNGGSNPEQVGLGVSVGAIENNMSQGSDQNTGNALDVAIQNEGFFTVANSTSATGGTAAGTLDGTTPNVPKLNAQPQYTRAGNFTVNSEGFLVTQSGQYVEGASAAATSGSTSPSGSPIYIPTGATNVAIAANGQVTYTDSAGSQQTAGYLQLATFPNNAGLSRAGGSLWNTDPAAGAPSYSTPGANGVGGVQSGELESSNVDMAAEFSNMIEAQNGYEADSKVITTADQMLQALVQMPQG